ncbi:cupredoxin domain-containing protein [Georgenia sp. SUBG003]|uniref:cupredoxin domain-containing protein n=1 Tax=Georgenia sp. SUBG003 TaxID=1497974 RepID=UPI0004D857CA|nr:hypothetical protein DA06_17685 [Georgenia sp. SUBG003]
MPSVLAVALTLLAAACTPNDPGGQGATGAPDGTAGSGTAGTVTVTSTSDSCELSARTAPEGRIVFSVTNDGTEPTEFYLYDEDGQQVIAEVENIGPGLTRDLIVNVPAGMYETACKPGMVGDGIRAPFTVE